MNHPIKLNRTSGRWTKLWSVESESRAGTFYVIGRADSGEWACSCPRWIFNRECCKHIRHVQASIEAKQIQAQPDVIPAKLEKTLSRFALIE